MRGKKRTGFFLFLAVALSVMLTLSGCGRKEDAAEETEEIQAAGQDQAGDGQTGPETEENVAEETEEEIPEVLEAVVSETSVQEIATTDNVILLRSSVQDVRVTIPGNAEAAEQINQFFADRKAAFADTTEEYRKIAQEDWEERAAMSAAQEEAEAPGEGQETETAADTGAEEAVSWQSYELGVSFCVKRVDERLISIVEDSFEYTGGAHPNSVRVAYNFDTQTGERLKLEDVASDLDEIRTESTQYLGDMFQDEKWQEVLFSDYKNHLEDILTDSTWYTDEEGFHIICNEYIITPHSEGILDFLLPYDEVDVIAEGYKPVTGTDTPKDDQSGSPQSNGD